MQSFFLKKVKEQSIYVWGDKVCGLALRWLGGLLGLSVLMVGLSFKRLPPEIPLWFSRPWGITQLADKKWVLIFPASLTIMSGLILMVAGMVYREEKLLARLLMAGGALIAFLLVYALGRIILLVL